MAKRKWLGWLEPTLIRAPQLISWNFGKEETFDPETIDQELQ